jgi:SAM-dependent methyltransferase
VNRSGGTEEAGSDERHRVHAASFGRAAEAYERGRPPYPAAAIDWLLPAGAGQVLDLGAGTGKLTRQLVARGLEVTAVEPSDGMRAQLRAVLPGIPAFAGTAEQIPLPDNSFDCVLVAQAWHWVDPALALPEVARVLRPGGRLGLVWNLRDERVAWIAELGEFLRAGSALPAETEVVDLGPEFGVVERLEVEWAHTVTPDELLDMVASRSYVITASADRRNALLTRVANLVETHPALAGRDRFPVPYLTDCYRAAAVDLNPG